VGLSSHRRDPLVVSIVVKDDGGAGRRRRRQWKVGDGGAVLAATGRGGQR
jgi:hypothetical protein